MTVDLTALLRDPEVRKAFTDFTFAARSPAESKRDEDIYLVAETRNVVSAILAAAEPWDVPETPEAVREQAAEMLWDMARDAARDDEWQALAEQYRGHWRRNVDAIVPILRAADRAEIERLQAELFAETQGRELLAEAQSEVTRLTTRLAGVAQLVRPILAVMEANTGGDYSKLRLLLERP